ncbi:MAG TPA: hypothetical protein VJO16_13770 [Candidatus Acidoferrum sp.]|nr:hypothetical protein [Candidatus Acidoferrum sp.]
MTVFALRELPRASGRKFGHRCDASWLISAIIDAGENFIEFASCKALRRQFLLGAEHDLRARADDASIRSNRVLPIPAQPELAALAEQDLSLLVPASGQISSLTR